MKNPPDFDVYAGRYEEASNKGLSLTGEYPDYYAKLRVQATKRFAERYRKDIERVLDFGCGIGLSVPYLNETFRPLQIIGVDVSSDSLSEARGNVRLKNASFHLVEEMHCTKKLTSRFVMACFIISNPNIERRRSAMYFPRSVRVACLLSGRTIL